MKKLNKILMPIVGLSTMATGVIPVTSCSCSKYTDGVQVTNHEWKDALTNFATPKEGVSWKSSTGDYVQELDINGPGYSMGFYKYSDITIDGEKTSCYSNRKDTRVESNITSTNLTSFRKNNYYYNFFVDNTSSKKIIKDIDITPLSPIQKILTDSFNAYCVFSKFEWNNESKTYDFTGVVQDTEPFVYVKSQVRFNSDKKITYLCSRTIQSSLKYAYGDHSYICTDVVLHPQYQNVTVDVDQEYLECLQKNTISINASTTIKQADYLAPCDHKKMIVIISICPSVDFKNIQFIPDGYVGVLYVEDVYKNNSLLDLGVEYTGGRDNGEIIFAEKVTAKDKIDFVLEINMWKPSAEGPNLLIDLYTPTSK